MSPHSVVSQPAADLQSLSAIVQSYPKFGLRYEAVNRMCPAGPGWTRMAPPFIQEWTRAMLRNAIEEFLPPVGVPTTGLLWSADGVAAINLLHYFEDNETLPLMYGPLAPLLLFDGSC